MDRRQVIKLFGALAAAGATGAAAGCTEQPEGTQMERPSGLTINIGLVAPALGLFSKIGDDITKGFKLYLDDSGGLLGRHRVNLSTAEEGPTAQSATAATRGLLKNAPLAIAGVANPAALTAIAPLAQDVRVPVISASASPSGLATALFVWRVSQVDGEAGRALARYARDEGEKAYLLCDDTPSAQEDAREFRSAYEDLGGQIVGEDKGSVNFADRLQRAAFNGANVIVGSYLGAEALALLEAYRTSGLEPKLLGPGGLTETAELTKLSTLPSRVYTAMYYAADLDNEENRRFVASYHKAHGVQPSSYAMSAYDSAAVIDRALRLIQGPPTAVALNQAMSLLGQIESPRGTWTFNIRRTPQQRWYLRRLRLDGQVPANMLDEDLVVLS